MLHHRETISPTCRALRRGPGHFTNESRGTTMADPYNLQRFVTAQNAAGTYDHAMAELRRDHKTSHWMWFVFPQIAGLGRSQMSRTYAISSLAEAQAYLQHPVLGPRLQESAAIVANAKAKTAEQIFGPIDPH